jgi:hypothetical protein
MLHTKMLFSECTGSNSSFVGFGSWVNSFVSTNGIKTNDNNRYDLLRRQKKRSCHHITKNERPEGEGVGAGEWMTVWVGEDDKASL